MNKLKIMNRLIKNLCLFLYAVINLYSYRCGGREKIFAQEFLETAEVVAVIRRSKRKNFFFSELILSFYFKKRIYINSLIKKFRQCLLSFNLFT